MDKQDCPVCEQNEVVSYSGEQGTYHFCLVCNFEYTENSQYSN